MNEHSVIIAGGGPTGLLLASELRLAGVDVAVVEQRLTQDIAGLRAGGLHSRSIEILDQRGIADRFLCEGQIAQVAGFAGIKLDISDFPSRHPYGLGLWQNHIERILAGWAEELSVIFYRGTAVTGFVDDGHEVRVELSSGTALCASYPPWELPVLGPIPAPSAVLIRPDGYIAWVAEASDAGLHDVLVEWFGGPR